MDEIPSQGGAQKHFESFVQTLKWKGHTVNVYCRKVGVEQEARLWTFPYTRQWNLHFINTGDYDIVFVMHYKSVWILPFIKKPCVYYLLEPPRWFTEPWIYDILPLQKKLRVYAQGRIDRAIVRRFMRYGIANSHYSAEAGYRAYGRFFDVVYPGVDRTEFYPEDES